MTLYYGDDEQDIEPIVASPSAPESVQRGDAFDIGQPNNAALVRRMPYPMQTDPLQQFIENPSALSAILGINEKQAQNVISALVGGGTGLGHKLLSKYLGDVPAATLSALLTSLAARKLIRGQMRRR